MGNAVSSISNEVSQGLNSNLVKGGLLGGAIAGPMGILPGGMLGNALFGGRGGSEAGPGAPNRSVYLRPDQMRTMGNQYQYRGAPPQMPQGMSVVPLWARQGMQQQMQPQQFQPNWDVNAYNPNQNMQMRQQQMQQQMRGTPYQNMGMFGAFNPYMPRQR